MQLPGYEILAKAGEGATAVVWKAQQLSLHRPVAIKVLRPEYARRPEDVSTFIREARSAASLKHANIVHIYDVAEHEGQYFFVMEFVNGSTVADILARRGSLPAADAMGIIVPVAEALAAAWDQARLIHRDVKPGNIMIEDDGSVKLADLGLARIIDPDASPQGRQDEMIESTPNYAAPEQARGVRDLDCRVDMYGLGATLYHMVTGKIPFDRADPEEILNRQVSETLPPVRSIKPSIPLPVSALIERLLMKNPEDRFPDWAQALHEIKQVAAGRILLHKGATEPKRITRRAPDKGPQAIRTRRGEVARTISARPSAPRIPFWLRVAIWTAILAVWVLAARRAFDGPRSSAPQTPPAPQPARSVEP